MPHCPKPADQHRKLADVTALISKAPRTFRELTGLADVSEGLVRRWVKALADEGLVERDEEGRRESRFGFKSTVWKWRQ